MVDKLNTKDKFKLGLATASLTASLVIAFIALFTPPEGEIHDTVLWFTAQLLIFCSTLLGLNVNFGRFGKSDTDSNNEKK